MINKIDHLLKNADSILDKIEKFAMAYIFLAFVFLMISFLYNIIIRSL